ncbi:MAG TPA: universal stress protein [Kofleriaceae bacterium]|nr:universal stress protein [Kofleriaceae bacterium]
MITRVVAATDFSPEADLAVAHAVVIAKRHGANLTVVFAEPERSTDDDRGDFAELAAEADALARQELEARVASAAAAGIDTDGVLRYGAPDEVIAEVARDLGAELTVIGTHGRTGVKRFFLGSVAERVIKRTPDAALVVRGAPPEGGFRRVLVATDFSDAAFAALSAAITLAAPDAQLDVIHAWQYPPGTWGRLARRSAAFKSLEDAIVDAARASASSLQQQAASLRAFEVELRQGAPAATIADAAEHGHHDLIAVGTHGHQGVRRFLLGSVAEAVVRHAHASVVVAHAAPRA